MKYCSYKKFASLLCGGMLLGILPGCAEVFLLNIATPFLLGR